MIKLLIGGSPCTHWSIAQKKNREVVPEGEGWELFKNYLVAREKFKPDFFLYENNKSAAQAIKDQISTELDVDLMHINSSLVSAQSRQRFYAFNWHVDMPEDRHIYLGDILDDVEISLARYEDRTVRVGHINSKSQGNRIYYVNGKSTTISANGGGWGAKTGLYAVPVSVGYRSRRCEDGKNRKRYETSNSEKANALTTVTTDSMVAIPKNLSSILGKAYNVSSGKIWINGREYSIKLPDGRYVIRKLTPTECERLQTMPEGYTKSVSDAQRYKCLGNGWTAEVIIHILNGALKDVPRDEELIVLSMYDGIGTGRYCLDRMGFTNVKYYAYEIDKYAIQVATDNYPDIIEMGDAFDLRKDTWSLKDGEIFV